MIQGIVVYCVA